MKLSLILLVTVWSSSFCQAQEVKSDSVDKPDRLPNILVILADDLGYGDVGCYNPDSRIPTPNLDRLATEGMRFTDAHSPCTVCTPTRYSLLTGQMAFRIPNGGRVFSGAGGPSLIAKDRLTLPQMLRERGYSTGCFGKWHVGLTFYDQEGKPIHDGSPGAVERIDYSREIDGGPLDCGFDQFFGTACCPTTDWLYAYIDGRKIPVPPVKWLDKSTLPTHAYSNDNRRGLVADDFDLEEVDIKFLEKSQQFLKQHSKNHRDKPFFLLHSTQAVHLPSFPGNQFKGKTESGPHGDFIFELDHVVGELVKTLDDLGLAENTIVIFTSDNGPEVPTVYHMRHDHDHDGARPWRGMKRDNWEGGHRVPMIVRWPGQVPVDRTSSQLTSLTDIMATAAEIVGVSLPDDAGEDSFSMLPAMLGTDGDQPIRPYILQQGFGGKKYLAIRRGKWKYLAHKGSGGNRYETHEMLKEYQLPELTPDSIGQLYDLENDPGETMNLAETHPEIVEELNSLLEKSIDNGRSAPIRILEQEPKELTPQRMYRSGPRMTLGVETNLSASVRLADLDHDGDLDCVVANGRHWPEQNFLFLNQGRGNFNVQRRLGEDQMTTYATEIADLDGDGDLDIAVGNDLAPNLIFLNDGLGRFENGQEFGEISSVRSLTLADLDVDGDMDILSTCRGRPNQIYLNDGKANFSLGKPFGDRNDSTIDVAVGDVNLDGYPDLVLANRDGQQNNVLLNDGQMNFTKRVPFGSGSDETRAVVIADLNADGNPDLVTGNIGQPNAVYFGDGLGGFDNSVEFGRADSETYALAVADMDNDGDLDLIEGNSEQENAVWFNLGEAKNSNEFRFAEVRFGDVSQDTYGLDVGDLNNDGFKDIVVANSGSANLVFLSIPIESNTRK